MKKRIFSVICVFIGISLAGCYQSEDLPTPQLTLTTNPVPIQLGTAMAQELLTQTAVAGMTPVPGTNNPSSIPGWEYKTLTVNARIGGPAGEQFKGELCETVAGGTVCFGEDLHQALLLQLNNLGSDGWELVSVIYAPQNDAAVYLFKRPK